MAILTPVVTKAGPWLIKQLPKLWPLLLDAKNREKVTEAIQNLASQSPTKRLRAKVELTAALADSMSARAESEVEKARAREWARRAQNLLLRLDMPTADRALRRSQTKSVEQQLTALQREMDGHLNHPATAQPQPTEEVSPGEPSVVQLDEDEPSEA